MKVHTSLLCSPRGLCPQDPSQSYRAGPACSECLLKADAGLYEAQNGAANGHNGYGAIARVPREGSDSSIAPQPTLSVDEDDPDRIPFHQYVQLRLCAPCGIPAEMLACTICMIPCSCFCITLRKTYYTRVCALSLAAQGASGGGHMIVSDKETLVCFHRTGNWQRLLKPGTWMKQSWLS